MVSNYRALVPIIGFFDKEGLEPRLIEDGLNRQQLGTVEEDTKRNVSGENLGEDQIEHCGTFHGSKRLNNWYLTL